MVSSSRMLKYSGKTLTTPDGELKNGDDYRSQNSLGFAHPGVITRWRDGKLGDGSGLPAVEFADTHTEYWKEGRLHRDEINENGLLLPAVISDYGEITEYWLNGIRVDRTGKPLE
jgi:hypothetical protein